MNSTKYSIAADLTYEQKQKFLRANANLIACLDVSAEALFKKISADMVSSDNEAAEESMGLWGKHIDHEDSRARKMAQESFGCDVYRQFCLAFLYLKQRGAIQFSIELTPEAQAELFELEVASGCRRPKQAIAEEAAAHQAAESLDQEITADWQGRLTTSAIQAKKKANTAYATRLTEMLDGGQL